MVDSLAIARHANTISGVAVALALLAVAGWAFTESTVTVTEFEPGSNLVHTESRIHQPADRWLQLSGAVLCLVAVAVRSGLPFPRIAAGLATVALAASALLAFVGFLSPSLARPPALDDVVDLNGGCAECQVSTTVGFGIFVALAASAASALATATLAAAHPTGGSAGAARALHRGEGEL